MVYGIIIAAVVFLIVAFCLMGYVKAPPNTAYLISGPHKKPRILIGKAGFRIPIFERIDRLYLGVVPIDVKTSSSVPTAEFVNIKIDANVNVRIGQTPEMMELAAKNFLNKKASDIALAVQDLLEGNTREIIGATPLVSMVNDRKSFSEKVQENAVPDLARFGLELVSFNVQNFVDDNKVIENLGIDNISQISKQAAIARSNAEREIQIAEAENIKKANDAKAQSAEDIAIRNTALEVKKAKLKTEMDTQKAQAEAALGIESEKQRQVREVAATEANIARTAKESELKEKEIKLKEYELDALVRKQADADKYAKEKAIEAALAQSKANAEAIRYQQEQEAEAMKAKADAEKYAALAQAEGIAAVGKAEAEAIQKKAEAQKKMGEASVLELYLMALPQIVEAASKPLSAVDKITMYGSDNSSQLVKEVMNNSSQIIDGISETTGINIKDIITSYMGNKLANNNN